MLQHALYFRGARPDRGPMQAGAMTDLLRRLAEDRDTAAFQQLFQAYGPKIKSYMVRQGADLGTAEELAQETLLMVWRKAALFSPDKGTPASWIFRIARNLRIDRLRREPVWYGLPDHFDQADEDQVPPDEALSAAERRVRVRSALATLPDDQRVAVTLSYIDGLSQQQIAERLSVPLGTVKSRMRLAYAKIRAAVEDLQ